MNKKVIIGIVAVVVIAGGWYMLSPLWRVVEVNEASPLDRVVGQVVSDSVIIDAMATMDQAVKVDMEKQVADMNKEPEVIYIDTLPVAPQLLAQGQFVAKAHEVAGSAKLIIDGTKKILRLEGLETVNGPDLHIYLANELDNAQYIDLGKIRATRGNVNYPVDSEIDTAKFNKVLIWCQPFSVLFSYAELQPVTQ
jgi:hypothetical protein